MIRPELTGPAPVLKKTDTDPGEAQIFMLCEELKHSALSTPPTGYVLRHPKQGEVELCKRMQFDDEETARREYAYMTDYFNRVYAPHGEAFYNVFRLAVDADDKPVGTCGLWKAYGCFYTVQWLKVTKPLEGRGIGRALLSSVLRDLPGRDYPVYLHTQAASFRAIKLYSDFGFRLITNEIPGPRPNELERGLPFIKKAMPKADFSALQYVCAPKHFLDCVETQKDIEF